jgi:regulator of telomere elongation helicase 1
VNPAVNMNKGFALNAACKSAKKAISPCIYYKNKDVGNRMSWDVADIEELHKLSERHKFCPYYSQKERVAAADIIFMPYNYLLDEKIRENFNLEYDNSIIIFDEGHNI